MFNPRLSLQLVTLALLVSAIVACTPAPTATPIPTTTATATPVPILTETSTSLPTATSTPIPTVTSTSTPTPTSTPTATPRPQAQTNTIANLYTGPDNAGFTSITQLPQGAKVTPLGMYGDFVQVETEISKTIQIGFVLKQVLDSLPTNLPQLSMDKIPWSIVTNYTTNAPLTNSNPKTGWADKLIDTNIVLPGRFRLIARVEGQGESNIIIIVGRESPGGEWWQGTQRFELVLYNANTFMVNLRDGTTSNALYNKGFPKPSDGIIILEFDQNGKVVTILDSSERIIRTIDITSVGNFPNGMFPQGIKRIVLSSGSQSRVTVSQLVLQVVPDGKIRKLCESPHFQNRTSDRKTGYRYFYQSYKHFLENNNPQGSYLLYPPDSSPRAPYNNGAMLWRGLTIPGYDYAWTYFGAREAQITAIDKERHVIALYIGRGQTVQRKFATYTHVVMELHAKYVGQPANDAKAYDEQYGGNFCDLEVGDLVALLDINFDEVVNPKSGLIDLWGILIVQ